MDNEIQTIERGAFDNLTNLERLYVSTVNRWELNERL